MPLDILTPQPEVPIREFSDEEIARFLERDRFSPEAEAIVRLFEEAERLDSDYER